MVMVSKVYFPLLSSPSPFSSLLFLELLSSQLKLTLGISCLGDDVS